MIVVGAGPAGATAAYYLATGGRQVALLEKASFPRDKYCGDAWCAPALDRPSFPRNYDASACTTA